MVDYKNKNISDRIAVIGELEHIRRHALRSAHVDEDNEVFYNVVAKRARDLRREYMAKYFDAPDPLHCLGKATASLRQLVYESDEGDTEMVKKMDALVDMVWGEITGEDLSGCISCKEDKLTKSE